VFWRVLRGVLVGCGKDGVGTYRASCEAVEVCWCFGVWPGDNPDVEAVTDAVRLRLSGSSFIFLVERGV
jgi:hypothetical protein